MQAWDSPVTWNSPVSYNIMYTNITLCLPDKLCTEVCSEYILSLYLFCKGMLNEAAIKLLIFNKTITIFSP